MFLSSIDPKMKMKMAVLCPLLLLIFSVFPCYISSHSSPSSYYSDQEALLSFKHSLSLDPNNYLSDWSPHHSFCNWTGVVCASRHQRVVSLNLTGMSLVGAISPFIGNLSFLRVLSLKNNSFQGQIPSHLGKLFRLRILRLSRNQLEGSIPSTLANCHSLEQLVLSYNLLSGNIPSQLGLLSHLETLILGVNQLTGTIPPSLGNLSSLVDLELLQNKFNGDIPIELCMLSQLENLYLGKNKLTGVIPNELGMLTQLRTLYLDTNNLTGVIPITLSNCTLIQILSIANNQLAGHIPWQLGKLSKLEDLHLWGNQLVGKIPSSLRNVSSLVQLSLQQNKLYADIPIELGMLTQLRILQLDTNYLTGVIPTAISNCTLLEVLQLHKNQLTGHIPLEVSKLVHLQRIFLWENRLVSGNTGLNFLIALSNCTLLDYLDLSSNYLTGNLPSSVGHLLGQLSVLMLYSNKIEGNIPRGIGNLTKLFALDLSSNVLNGSIPMELGQLQNLQGLYLDKNNLEGRIPRSFGHAKYLAFLSLSENMISGQIPESLGDLPQLRDLVLHHNQLTGKIPASLGRCITLQKVDLAHNKLQGNMPLEWENLANIQFYFNVSSNSLQGSILAMSKMVMVQAIDVSHNNFSGEIPAILSSCTNLQYLNLSWNSFDGPIPESLTSLKNLQSMDISSNNLSGTIPMAFQEMKMLKNINLSSNRLVGEVPRGGVFAKIKESEISGNVGLCGNWIKLKPCSNSKHKHLFISKKVMVAAILGIGIVIMSSILLLYLYRRPINKDTSSINKDSLELNIGLERISYEEVEDATDGFSQTNLLWVGRFGSVYRGILNNGTNIAVKVFNSLNKNALHSFQIECNVLKRVRHRNVIKVISTCSNLDFKALVLPFMSNGSLESWLYPKEGDICRLNLNDRLRIAKEIAQGMEYLHHHCFEQVIHGDLKPNNILLGDDMTPHIADFGISKLLSENSMTSTSALKGSIGYFAPEYGVGGTISTNGDVYSYGILLLELLTTRRPTDTMFENGINLPKWASIFFPNKIEEVVEKCLLEDVNISDKMRLLECLTHFMQIGLVCTRELPQQRPTMMQIVERLEKITSTFLGIGRDFHLPINISPFIGSTSGVRNTNLRNLESWSTSSS